MNKKDRLNEKEINEIFNNYKMKENEIKKNEYYMNNCEKYKENNCRGDIYTLNDSGCAFCRKNNMNNSDYAKPPYRSEEFEELEKKKNKARKMAVAKCNFYIDEKYCGYKDTFNYCDLCHRLFKRDHLK